MPNLVFATLNTANKAIDQYFNTKKFSSFILEDKKTKKNLISSGFSDYFAISFGVHGSSTFIDSSSEVIQTQDSIFNLLRGVNHNVVDGFIGLNINDIVDINLILGFYRYQEGEMKSTSYNLLYGAGLNFNFLISGKADCVFFMQPDYKASKDFIDKTKEKSSNGDNSHAISIGLRLNAFSFSIPFVNDSSLKLFASGRYFTNNNTATLSQVWKNLFETAKYKNPKKLWHDIMSNSHSLILSTGIELYLVSEAMGLGAVLQIYTGYNLSKTMAPSYVHNFMDEPCLVAGQESYIGLKIEPCINLSEYGEIKLGYKGFKIFNTNRVQKNGVTETKIITQNQHNFSLKLEFSF